MFESFSVQLTNAEIKNAKIFVSIWDRCAQVLNSGNKTIVTVVALLLQITIVFCGHSFMDVDNMKCLQ